MDKEGNILADDNLCKVETRSELDLSSVGLFTLFSSSHNSFPRSAYPSPCRLTAQPYFNLTQHGFTL